MKEIRIDYDLYEEEKELSEIQGYENGYNDALSVCDKYIQVNYLTEIMYDNTTLILRKIHWKNFLDTLDEKAP